VQPNPTVPDVRAPRRLVWLLAVLATVAKLLLAWRTRGTVDVASFWDFGGRILGQGMPELWKNDPLFNHMPLVGWFASVLRGIFPKDPQSFSFWWRVPAIAADLLAVWAVLRIARLEVQRVRIAVMIFAVSPVSLMVSGFHGNVDPILIAFLIAAAALAVEGRLMLSALALALAFNVKAAGIIVAPLFLAHWISRGAGGRFFVMASVLTLAGWAYPLMSGPAIFVRNVLSYGGYWGTWGITYWLRQTGWEPWSSIRFGDYTVAQTAVILPLKLLIIGTSFALAWRRRKGGDLIEGIAVLWLAVMALAPSGAAQYLVWCAPFLAVARPQFFPWITAASAVHLFVFYTVFCGGLPWDFGIAREKTNWIWLLTTNIPWLAFAACLGLEFRRSISPGASRAAAPCSRAIG
jgi:hypothetical protein